MRRAVVGAIAIAVSFGVGAMARPVGATTVRPPALLPRAWSVRVGPAGYVSTPVISHGRAFTTDAQFIAAVALERGNVKWQVDHTDPGFGPLYLQDVSLVNGEVLTPFAIGRFGGIAAHDPKTGAFTISGSDIIFGHIVTHAGQTATLYGGVAPGIALIALQYGGTQPGLIDVSSGSLAARSDPVFAGGHHVWVGYGASVLRFDPDGECAPPPVDIPFCMPNQSVPLAGTISGLAGGPDDTIVATTTTGVVHVFDGRTGTELWRATPGGDLTRPAVSRHVIVVGGSDGLVHAYDAGGCGASTCAARWRGDAGAAIETAPALGSGLAFVGTTAGALVAFAAAGCGTPLCRPVSIGHTKQSSPVTSGPVFGFGTVVVGSADGRLVGFRPV